MSPGSVLDGKYRLISMLGHGGMGSVWRAERIDWQAPVAIKLMHLPGLQDAHSLARFQREAHLAASLRSIHIVQVLDDGVDAATGTPFIVMELLEGESLAERLVRLRRLRPAVVAQIVSQIARALGRAHDAGLIHRDLKPDNILIVRNDDEEVIKVLDFGIAKWMISPHQQGPRTISGQMLGTPVYMSPEQFGSPSKIDHRADLWSLGVIAYECMTGVRPFQGDTLVSLALQVCSGEPPLPSSVGPVPEGFDAWFGRAVAKNPERRFASARAMAAELRGLCGYAPLLWESEAVAPHQHLPREKTELEPVLELRRRARSVPPGEPAFLPTDLGSVLPTVPPEPVRARPSRLWLGLGAMGMALLGAASVLMLELSGSSVDRLASRLRQVTTHLRRNFDKPPTPSVPPGTAGGPREYATHAVRPAPTAPATTALAGAGPAGTRAAATLAADAGSSDAGGADAGPLGAPPLPR